MSALIIAECGSNWRFGDNHLENAYRMIQAAKDCGADVAKFQWTSNAAEMASRRKLPDATAMYGNYVAFPSSWLPHLKAECDKVGIEFACTVYLRQDIGVIAPLVSRFKVSAYESTDSAFIVKHMHKHPKKEIILSVNPGRPVPMHLDEASTVRTLHCMSEYPTPLERLHLEDVLMHDGLSDHTTSLISGAVAVGCGATIIEKHVRLSDTPESCPDYGHSLALGCGTRDPQGDWGCEGCAGFHRYVEAVRESERML